MAGSLLPLLACALPLWAGPLASRPVPLARAGYTAAAAAVPLTPLALSAPPLALDPAAGVYERRGVGLLAVDLRGSTELHQRIGNRKAHAFTASALELAEATAAAFDGTVVRRMGDGYLMIFPEAERAMQAAAAIQESLPAWRERENAPPLELRAAVHAGRVLVDARGAAPEAYGQSVERALALADISGGGDVAMEPALAGRLLASGWAGRVVPGTQGGVATLRPTGASAALPERKAPAPAAFERRATLFTSLVDWPAVFEKHGRRRAYATVKAFHAHVRGIVEAKGGELVKTTGDTAMAVFPDGASAVAAGLEIQSRLSELGAASPLGRYVAARVGVSAGRVLREESVDGVVDYFGNTVNAAARLMKRAAPGEVLVGGRALEGDAAAQALMEGAERSEASVKGFPAPIPVAGLTPRRVRAHPAAVSRLRRVADDAIRAVPPRD
jgi:class 3 adenylate cyclase